MGAYAGTYLGIYLIVPYGTKTSPKTILVNPQTGKETKHPFDPSTGVKSESKTIMVTEENYPTPFENGGIEGIDENTFFAPEHQGAGKKKRTFILNQRNKYSEKIKEECFNIDITKLQGQKLVDEFKTEYSKYIDYLSKEYGPTEVGYGIVHYYH